MGDCDNVPGRIPGSALITINLVSAPQVTQCFPNYAHFCTTLGLVVRAVCSTEPVDFPCTNSRPILGFLNVLQCPGSSTLVSCRDGDAQSYSCYNF